MMKASFHKYCSKRSICLTLLALILLFSLLPCLLIGRYDRMCQDDYTFGTPVHLALERHDSVAKAIAGVVAYNYDAWQGTFSAVALFCLHPGVWNTNLYVITPILMIGALTASLGFFLYQIIRRALRLSTYLWAFSWLFVSFLCVQFPRSAMEAFYWYDSSVFYTLFFALFLFWCGGAIRCLFNRKNARPCAADVIVLPLLAMLISGGNYPVALLTEVASACFVALAFLLDRRKAPLFLAIFLLHTVGFAINVLAPGNLVRQLCYQKLSPIAAIFGALSGVPSRMGGMFFRHPGLPLLLVFVWTPFCFIMQKEISQQYRWPMIPVAVSWIILGIMFTPGFYATGTGGPDRLWNIVCFMFVLLLMANMFYLTGWIRSRFSCLFERIAQLFFRFKRFAPAYLLVCMIAMTAVSKLGPDLLLERGTPTCVAAAEELIDGTAKAYAAEWDACEQQILESDAPIVYVEPFSVLSTLLPNGDFIYAPYWNYELWYGKEYIGERAP